MDPLLLTEIIVNGILLGGLYSLLATGIGQIFGVTNVIYVAYGQMIMLGMYILFWLYSFYMLNLFLSFLLTAIILVLLAAVVHRVMTSLYRSTHPHQLLATLGIATFIENAVLLVWGPEYEAFVFDLPVLNVGGVFISCSKLFAFVGGTLTIGALWFFLNKTIQGKSLQAISQDPYASLLMGINPDHMYQLSLIIGFMAAGTSAFLLIFIQPVCPYIGLTLTNIAFIVVVMGGLGSIQGALLGGEIIGVSQALFGALIAPEIGVIISYVIFMLVLLFRPKGILGTKEV